MTVVVNPKAVRTSFKGLRARYGSALVGFIHSLTGAKVRNIQDRLRDVVHVTDFMTPVQVADVISGTGAVDVTAAVQAAIDAADTVIFPPGKYRLVALPDVIHTYGNDSSLDVYRAIDIDRDDINLVGLAGATIKFIGAGASSDISYAFATAKNMTLGTVNNFRACGLSWDFDPTGDSSPVKRSFNLIGVKGIVLEDMTFTSTGASRAGATITVQNSQTVRFSNLRFKHCTQGVNFSYVEDVVFHNIQFNDFNEAIDFDRKVTGFHLKNLTFLGNSSTQALDLNSCSDGTVDGVYATDVPNVCTVNYKSTTPETYADYVNYPSWPTGYPNPVVFSPSKRVLLRGFRGSSVGSAVQGCINLGFDRTAFYDGGGPCEDITVEDVKFTDCGIITVEDVKNFVLRDIHLADVVAPTSASFGAITLTADASFADAELSGVLQRVRVINCEGKGIRVQSPTRIVFDDVLVDGFNTANTAGNGKAFELTALNARRAEIHINRTQAKNGTNSPVAWTISENSGAGSFESQIYWGEGNIIELATVPTAVEFGQANTQKRIKKRAFVLVGTLTLSSGTRDYPLLMPSVNQGVRLCWAAATVSQTLASDATNYLSHSVRSRIGGSDAAVASGSFTAGATAGAETDMNVAYNEAAAQAAAGDIIYARIGVAGTGGTIQGLGIYVHYMDYATT